MAAFAEWGCIVDGGSTSPEYPSKDKNKAYFKKMIKSKEAVEQAFGNPLDWEELPDNKMSRVKFELQDVNLFNDNHWEKMNQFFIEYLPKFENAFRPFIKNLK